MNQHVWLDFLWIDSDALISGGEVTSLVEGGEKLPRCRGSFRGGKLEFELLFVMKQKGAAGLYCSRKLLYVFEQRHRKFRQVSLVRDDVRK